MSGSVDILHTRIGQLLVNRKMLSQAQLSRALNYQAKHKVKLGQALTELKLMTSSQIAKVLRKQKILRLLAGGLSLTVSPTSLMADQNLTTGSEYIVGSVATNSLALSSYTKPSAQAIDLVFDQKPLDHWSKEFYFSGDKEHLVALNRDFDDIASIQFSLFNAKQPLFSNHYEYQFEPQISLYSSGSESKKSQYSASKRIGPGLDRQSNTKPVVYMLTLKGRCLYENAGSQTTMWSLDRAKKGVQRKAELMFSITKHF